MVFDFDDFGCNHIISGMCQSHDCRDKLLVLKEVNPDFKVTLFTIPGEMTPELIGWAMDNKSWVELAWHGFFHSSNYECEKISYDQMASAVEAFSGLSDVFVKGFKAPGWQISTEALQWLADSGWWVSDQDYNTVRRPKGLPGYINRNGTFFADKGGEDDWTEIEAWHGHTWDCVGNGIYETFDHVAELVRNASSFQFVSEVLK